MSHWPVVPVDRKTGLPGESWYRAGPVLACATTPNESEGWHLSVSRRDCIPTWAEIMAMKRELIPADVFMVVLVPPDRFWMNGHPNVIQLIQVDDDLSNARLCAHMRETAERANAEGWNNPPDDGRDLTR